MTDSPHRFIPYPDGHAITGACVRCGMVRDHHQHRLALRINWKRILDNAHNWRLYS